MGSSGHLSGGKGTTKLLSFFGFDRCDYVRPSPRPLCCLPDAPLSDRCCTQVVDIFATPFTFGELETPLYEADSDNAYKNNTDAGGLTCK